MTETTVAYVYKTAVGDTTRTDTVNDANFDATPTQVVDFGEAIASLAGGTHVSVMKRVTQTYEITDN